MEFQLVEFKVSFDDVLNIESVGLREKMFLKEDEMKVLAAQDLACFPQKCTKLTNTKIRKYYVDLVDFLTKEVVLVSNSNSNSNSNSKFNSNSNSMSCDGKMLYDGLYRTEFEEAAPTSSKVAWKFFVYMEKGTNVIAASCLVERNLIYNTYEIHSVCVGEIGKGH